MILEQAAALKDAVPIILHHHERFAGHGYPYGLRGNEIPLGRADRRHRRRLRRDDPRPAVQAGDVATTPAIAELRRHAGTQFDPELVALFCDLFASHAPLPDKRVEAITGTSGTTAAKAARRRRGAKVAGETAQIPLADGTTPESAAG